MLNGYHVLLVEDEFMLAQDLRQELEDLGAIVLGPEPSVEQALARVSDESRIDVAILDVNLNGRMVYPVAEVLEARDVPFLFVTGYQEEVVRERYPAALTCDKPVNLRLLMRSLQAMVG